MVNAELVETKQLYIQDKEGNLVPRTPIKAYNHALMALGMAETLLDFEKLPEAKNGFTVAEFEFKEALIFGVPAAALAYIHNYRYSYLGLAQDDEMVKLYIIIGHILENKICTDFMNGKNHEIYNMADFLEKHPSSKSYSQNIFSKAEKYVQAVKEIQQKYGVNPLLTTNHANAVIDFFKCDPSHAIKIFKGFEQHIPDTSMPSTSANATEGASSGLLQVPKGNTLYVTPDTSSGYLSTEHSEAAFLPPDREGLIP